MSAAAPQAQNQARDLRRIQARAFLALCGRDLWVTVRHEPVGFLAQSLLQPLFFLFVFGRVLPDIGAARGAYGTQLMPGVMALTLVLTSLQNTALPLVIEFSFTKEIEDRLLAPVSTAAVALQKVAIAALRGVIAAALIIPLAALILPAGINLDHADWPALAGILVAGSLAGACLGLMLGTAVPPNKISVMFAIILTPLIFTGATFYPWQGLGRLQWFQVVTLFNPLTYVSEGLRASLTAAPSLATWAIAAGLIGSLVLAGALGVRGFVRRAVD
jgi:ABC-2 type transport system permease protein